MKAIIFLIITPKFQLQIHYTLEVTTENVPFSGVPILIFLCISIKVSSLVSHTYDCPGDNGHIPFNRLYDVHDCWPSLFVKVSQYQQF